MTQQLSEESKAPTAVSPNGENTHHGTHPNTLITPSSLAMKYKVITLEKLASSSQLSEPPGNGLSSPKERPRRKKARLNSTGPAYAHTVVEIRSIKEIGNGVSAKKAFHPTDVIFEEKPLLVAKRTPSTRELFDAARGLPQPTLLLLLSFEANAKPNSTGIAAIFAANAMPCVEEDMGGDDVPCGIFKYLSRVNHSCAPNAGWFWSSTAQRMLVIAHRDIEPNEEITASYCDMDLLCQSRALRQAAIKKRYLFDCRCKPCVDPGSESDKNRTRLGALLRQWGDQDLDMLLRSPKAEDDIVLGISLARRESLIAALCDMYLKLFYFHAAWGFYVAAENAVKQAGAALAMTRGRKHVQRHWIAELMADPKKWESWGICMPSKSQDK